MNVLGTEYQKLPGDQCYLGAGSCVSCYGCLGPRMWGERTLEVG